MGGAAGGGVGSRGENLVVPIGRRLAFATPRPFTMRLCLAFLNDRVKAPRKETWALLPVFIERRSSLCFQLHQGDSMPR